jgi:hypothetical protein
MPREDHHDLSLVVSSWVPRCLQSSREALSICRSHHSSKPGIRAAGNSALAAATGTGTAAAAGVAVAFDADLAAALGAGALAVEVLLEAASVTSCHGARSACVAL